MAVSLLSHDVSDLCIGKPPLRSLPAKATVGEALVALKLCGETFLSVSAETRAAPPSRAVEIAGKICMVDVLCFLCSEGNISNPAAALKNPVSALLAKGEGLVKRVEASSSILEALDVILDTNTQTLIVPIRSAFPKKKNRSQEFCWLTQEDLIRFFLNNIFLFSSIAPLSVAELGLVRPDVLSIHHRRPATSALPLLRSALLDGSSVAVVTDDMKLIGDIPPSILSACDDTVAPAVASLSVAELMAYIDDCCSHRSASEPALQRVKARLQEEGLTGMLGFLEGNEVTFPTSPSSSDDDESGKKSRKPRRMRSGSYMGRRSEEVAVCYEESSLVAVMVQALAHRVNYVWVVDDEEEFGLVGIVTFHDMLRVFREQIQ